MEPENPRLDDFILSRASCEMPRICLLPTASGDSTDFIERFYAAFPPERARATHLRLFRKDDRDFRSLLLQQDIIYVGGGSTVNMLAIWKAHGLHTTLLEAWHQGVILAGVSAGAICWFQSFLTDAAPHSNGFAAWDGLGILTGSACPHYLNESHRRSSFRELIQRKELPPGIGLPDSVAACYIGTELEELVASKPGLQAFLVDRRNGATIEKAVHARYLGA